MAFAFYMIVNERRREIGLLRAMGANRGHIAAIILTEAALLSAAGGAAGIVLGYGLLMSFKNLMLHYLKLPYLFPATPELILLTAERSCFHFDRTFCRAAAVPGAPESGTLRSDKERRMKPIMFILFMTCFLFCSCTKNKERDSPCRRGKDLFEELRDQTIKNPKDAEAWYHLQISMNAQMHLRRDECASKGHCHRPAMGYAYLKLGNAYNRLGPYQEAVTSFRKAIKYFPRIP